MNAKVFISKFRAKRLKQILLILICGAIINNEMNSDAEVLAITKRWEGHIQQELYDFGKKMNQLASTVSVSCDHIVANYSCTIYYEKDNNNQIATNMEIKKMIPIFKKKFQDILLEIKKKSGKSIAKNNLVVYTMPTYEMKKHKAHPAQPRSIKERFESSKNF